MVSSKSQVEAQRAEVKLTCFRPRRKRRCRRLLRPVVHLGGTRLGIQLYREFRVAKNALLSLWQASCLRSGRRHSFFSVPALVRSSIVRLGGLRASFRICLEQSAILSSRTTKDPEMYRIPLTRHVPHFVRPRCVAPLIDSHSNLRRARCPPSQRGIVGQTHQWQG